MKISAEKHARVNSNLSVRAAKLEVATLCQSEKTVQPPDDALEYLARELVRLTNERRSSRRVIAELTSALTQAATNGKLAVGT